MPAFCKKWNKEQLTYMKYFIAIPVYNEESSLKDCLNSLRDSVIHCHGEYQLAKTYACLNGCTDDSETILLECRDKMPELNIVILKSEKGMNRAVGKIVDDIDDQCSPVIKLDADITIHKEALENLLSELKRHPNLCIVGGQPFARAFVGKNPYRKLLASILDIRSRYPQSQVCKYDVRDFHTTAMSNPQRAVPLSFEMKSRIYFHGRFYAMRNKGIWDVSPYMIGDDTFLTLSVYRRFGRDTIRIRYDAICDYAPTTSLLFYWKVYKRIFCDIRMLFQMPDWKDMKDTLGKDAVVLDWAYISGLPLATRMLFRCYALIKKCYSGLFKIYPHYNESLWTYSRKN